MTKKTFRLKKLKRLRMSYLFYIFLTSHKINLLVFLTLLSNRIMLSNRIIGPD